MLFCCALATGTSGQPQSEPPRPLPDSLIATRQAELQSRLRRELDSTDTDAAAQRRVDQIVSDAAQLVAGTSNERLRYECLSIQLQSLHLRITRWPADPGVERRLSELRSAARTMKAIRQPNAVAIGDFWLTSAELFEIKNSDLPLADKQRQSEQVLRSLIVVHNSGPIVDAARAALRKLIEQSSAGNPDPQVRLDPNAVPEPEPTAEPLFALGSGEVGEDGVLRVPIRCRYQATENTIALLMPARPAEPGKPVRFLLVLPAEAGEGGEFGDPVETLRRLDLHNKHGLIIAFPTLSDTPWYGDHPTDLKMRQASYIARCVAPALRELVPSTNSRIMLLGFSRSGWGAVSLLCRYPREFESAAVFDAPLMLDGLTQPGMKQVFGTTETFTRYALPAQLRESARHLKRDKRLVLLGHDFFLEHMASMHKLLEELGVPHDYVEQPGRRHLWDSGWIEDAVARLLALGPQ